YSYGGPAEVTATDSLGGSTTFRFNDAGQPAQVLDALGRSTRFSYDALNHPVRISAPEGATFVQRFDPRGNLLTRFDPLGDRVNQTFDAELNQLLRFQDALGFSTDYDRDIRGNLTTLRYADGSFESYTVDSSGNITQVQ